MGPGVAVLSLCIAKTKIHRWKRAEYATLNPIHGDPTDPEPIGIGPIAGGLPAKIDAGEVHTFISHITRIAFFKRVYFAWVSTILTSEISGAAAAISAKPIGLISAISGEKRLQPQTRHSGGPFGRITRITRDGQ
jgi:hypothetical protein